IVLVLAALCSAQAAYLDALAHHMDGMLAAARQKTRRQRTDVGAVAVEHDAARHLLDIVFLQAERRAVFAGGDALDQRMFEVVGDLEFHGTSGKMFGSKE